MRYNEILLIITFIAMFFSIILKTKLDILLTIYIEGLNINANIYIKYLKVIKFKIPIYPSVKENKKLNKHKYKSKKTNNKKNIRMTNLKAKDIKLLFKSINEISVKEVYSNIYFGSTNVAFTSFIYLLINTIYSNVINLVDCSKVYLNVKPDFIKEHLSAQIKLNINPRIEDLLNISIVLFKIYKKINQRDGEKIEFNRVNKESYGNNI